MRSLLISTIALMALGLAGPASADEGPVGNRPTTPSSTVRAQGARSPLRARFVRVSAGLKREIGARHWQALTAFWKETVRDRVPFGQGRRFRAFLALGKSYAQALRQGTLDRFLESARERWVRRPIVPVAPMPRTPKAAPAPQER
jgi:hypothetical protein